MGILTQVLREATHVVARAASETASATEEASSQSSSAEPEPNRNEGNNNGSSSSPLLFFVALGFGVVFTNLWIIVGVKYCFRYNARNRQMRLNEDGEPITLETMPRPHRRRREKKLMTMDEVNDKFPMMKYKSWVSDRAKEGLPTTGGVSAPPTRPNSIREADGIVPSMTTKGRDSTDVRPSISLARLDETTTTAAVPLTETEKPKDTSTTAPENGQTSAPQTTTNNNQLHRVSSEDSGDDDDHIDGAMPPECMEGPGDTCAICIDTLEDDDDVRGLTCGHAFHAVCLDPWLTSRRACCPLCKADYYIPKPRPAPDAANPEGANNNNAGFARQNSRLNLPTSLRSVWFRGARSRTQQTPGSETARGNARQAQTEAQQVEQPAVQQQQTAEVPQSGNGGVMTSVRQALRFGRRPQNQPAAQGTGASDNVTPSQLEAANRTATTA